MTNIEKIIFDAKYIVKYMNEKIVISGFNHIGNLYLDEKKDNISDILEYILYFDKEDWEQFILEYNKKGI